MNPSRRFEEKVALITGAASGIGRACAVRLASEGARVFGHDLNAEGLAETAALVADAGGTMETRAGDISQAAECRAAVAACVETFGQLDVLGNNAGIARADHVTDVTEEQYRRMMGVNVDGYFFTAQAAIPHLLETDGQHRQRRVERRGHGPGVHGRVLHDEGRGRAAHAGARDGVREDEHARQRDRAERDPDHAVGELPDSGRRRRQPDAALHGLSPDGFSRRHRGDVRVRRVRRRRTACTARSSRSTAASPRAERPQIGHDVGEELGIGVAVVDEAHRSGDAAQPARDPAARSRRAVRPPRSARRDRRGRARPSPPSAPPSTCG